LRHFICFPDNYDGDLDLDGLLSVGLVSLDNGGYGLGKRTYSDETATYHLEISSLDDPSKIYKVEDKVELFQANQMVFYDTKNSLLYHKGDTDPINVIDAGTGEPVYENGEDKIFGYDYLLDFVIDDKGVTFLHESEKFDGISISLLDTQFTPLAEEYSLESNVFEETPNYTLFSHERGVMWLEGEFERRPSLQVVVLERKNN
jgi:hypothetical protein